MIKRILLSIALLLFLATNSWAQGCGCSSCDAGSGSYFDEAAYSEVNEGCGCAASSCNIGQGYVSADSCGCGCGTEYKYTRLFGGLGYVDDVTQGPGTVDFDDGWGAGGAIGRRVGRRRTELELGYRHNSFDLNADGFGTFATGNVSTTALMANMMFDILKIGKSNVYSGGGIGIAYGDAHIVTDGGAAVDDEAFAYQGIVGIDRDMRNNMKGFIEYRYLAAEFDFIGDFDYDAQNLFFGVELRR